MRSPEAGNPADVLSQAGESSLGIVFGVDFVRVKEILCGT